MVLYMYIYIFNQRALGVMDWGKVVVTKNTATFFWQFSDNGKSANLILWPMLLTEICAKTFNLSHFDAIEFNVGGLVSWSDVVKSEQ